MSWILIGKITKGVGLSGAVKVMSFSDDMTVFAPATSVRLSKKEIEYSEEISGEDAVIEKVDQRGNLFILKLNNSENRGDAEALRGQFIYIETDDLEELPEGSFYVYEIRGFDVISTDGERIGILEDVNMQAAQPLYKVKRQSGKVVYIPGVPAFIDRIDGEDKKIFVHVIEGLIDED